MPVAERDENRIVLTTEFREKELVKQIPGVRWSQQEATWWMPLSWAACQQLRGIFGDELQVGGALGAWAKEQIATRINPCLELRVAEDAPDYAFYSALRPFQRAGAKFLATAGQALIADEMGLGKTVQAITALEVLGAEALPALIVCPNSMTHTWKEEINKWAPARNPVVISGTPVQRRKKIQEIKGGIADVGIINFEGLRGHTRLEGYGSVTLSDKEKEPKELNEIQFQTVIADEAHRAKDPKSKQTRALWWVGRTARYRFALTGTPIANSPDDAWALMRFISPADFPAKTKFIERYALTAWNVYGAQQVIGIQPEHADELFRIIDPRFIRRLKAAVLPQLPPKQYTTRVIEMDTKQKKAYDGIRTDMLAQLDSGVLMTTSPLTKATRLIQFASCTGDVGDPNFQVRSHGQILADGYKTWEEANAYAITLQDAVVHDATPLHLTEPSCKVDAALEIMEEMGDEKVVFFAESAQLIDLVYARLLKEKLRVGQIQGKIPPHERTATVEAFNGNQLQALLITLGAGGEGISLTGCSTMVFLQRSFSMVKNLQAEDRLHGIGRGAEDGTPLTIIDVITANTIEAKVHAARADKEAMLEELVRDEATMKAWLAK